MPREADEHGDRRTQLGEELAAPGAQPLVHGREQPRPHELLRQGLLGLGGATGSAAARVRGRRARRRRHHPRGRPRRSTISTRSPSAPSADCPSTTSPGVAWCSAAASSSISAPASTSMSWISGSPTTKRRAGPTTTATFSARRTTVPVGVTNSPVRAIASCIASPQRRRADPVVAVEPAGDGVTTEVDDVAAEAIELGDQRLEDAVQAGGQLLRTALRPELGRPASRSPS